MATETLFEADDSNDGGHGTELWATDGTAAGTVPVDDRRSGSATSSPYGLTTLGSKVVFRANDGVHGSKVWVTDAPAAGHGLVKDSTPGASGSTRPTSPPTRVGRWD